jgi:hypothetical protein
MRSLMRRATTWLVTRHQNEEAQGTFEWLLLIGVVVVAVILAVATGFPGNLVSDLISQIGDAFTGLFS